MPEVTSGMLTTEQAADILGVSNATVLRANRVGSLASSGTSSDGDLLFSRDAVELYQRRRTELFRGAVRSGAVGPATKPMPVAAEPRAETPHDAAEDEYAAGEPEHQPEPEAVQASDPELEAVQAPDPEREIQAPEPEPEIHASEPEPARDHETVATLPEIRREEWLYDWATTLEWLDRLARSLLATDVTAEAPEPRVYEPAPAVHEPAAAEEQPTPTLTPAPADHEPAAAEEQPTPTLTPAPAHSQAVNLAVRPVVSFAILKEIGVALRARPGVVDARLDRLDSSAAWFVLRHDGSVPVDSSVASALGPLGFSVNRSGDDSFEVVQDSAGQTA